MKGALTIKNKWADAYKSVDFQQKLTEKWLPDYMQTCRWFGAKNAPIKRYEVAFAEMAAYGEHQALILFVEIVFQTAYSETYYLPLAWRSKDEKSYKELVIANLNCAEGEGCLVEALAVEEYRTDIFNNITHRKSVKLGNGSINYHKGKSLKKEDVTSKLLTAEQSNTTIVYNGKYYLKIYRKLFRGTNPDYEVSYHLSERSSFKNSPVYLGSFSLQRNKMYSVSLGLMQMKIDNNGEAWAFMLERVISYFKNIGFQ